MCFHFLQKFLLKYKNIYLTLFELKKNKTKQNTTQQTKKKYHCSCNKLVVFGIRN